MLNLKKKKIRMNLHLASSTWYSSANEDLSDLITYGMRWGILNSALSLVIKNRFPPPRYPPQVTTPSELQVAMDSPFPPVATVSTSHLSRWRLIIEKHFWQAKSPTSYVEWHRSEIRFCFQSSFKAWIFYTLIEGRCCLRQETRECKG